MLGRERDGLCSGVGNLRQQKDVRGSREDGPERNRSAWRGPGAPGVRIWHFHYCVLSLIPG